MLELGEDKGQLLRRNTRPRILHLNLQHVLLIRMKTGSHMYVHMTGGGEFNSITHQIDGDLAQLATIDIDVLRQALIQIKAQHHIVLVNLVLKHIEKVTEQTVEVDMPRMQFHAPGFNFRHFQHIVY